MSALARYFNHYGKVVAGYDRVSRPLTSRLTEEGIDIHFVDSVDLIPESFKDIKKTLVIYTPAVSEDNSELSYFRNNKFKLLKRSEVLGLLSREIETVAIAGTHGKTTISTMVAHILTKSDKGCNAFLGGISKNYETNLLLDNTSNILVAEADEFDRSFLHLYPNIALISSIDADHLDIYGNKENLIKSFEEFIKQIVSGGFLIIKEGILPDIKSRKKKIIRYSLNDEKSDFYAYKIRKKSNGYTFNVKTIHGFIENIYLKNSGLVQIENCVAAISVTCLLDVGEKHVVEAIKSFEGIQRRFDYHINNKDIIYIDDYAHHPEELRAVIHSVKKMYPKKRISGIFQPHLYSRTKDFSEEFAKSLDMLDELFLLDIYPAREKPVPGITSDTIFRKMKLENKVKCNKRSVLQLVKDSEPEVLLSLGAGDIDEIVLPLKQLLKSLYNIDDD